MNDAITTAVEILGRHPDWTIKFFYEIDLQCVGFHMASPAYRHTVRFAKEDLDTALLSDIVSRGLLEAEKGLE